MIKPFRGIVLVSDVDRINVEVVNIKGEERTLLVYEELVDHRWVQSDGSILLPASLDIYHESETTINAATSSVYRKTEVL